MEGWSTDDVAQSYDNIMDGVRKHIVDADIIIAVLTDENANVMYELGLAHAAKKKLVLMMDQSQNFRYRTFRALPDIEQGGHGKGFY